jgi:hypothetical protein
MRSISGRRPEDVQVHVGRREHRKVVIVPVRLRMCST